MSVILGVAAAMIMFVIAAVLSAMSKLIEEEIRGWIEVLPGIVLRMAAMRLPAAQRACIYRDEWLPEMLYISRKADKRPVSCFFISMRFALGLLRSARRIARHRNRAPSFDISPVVAAPLVILLILYLFVVILLTPVPGRDLRDKFFDWPFTDRAFAPSPFKRRNAS